MDPSFSSIISPIAPPISPVFSATPTFSPEVQVGSQKHHMDQNRKLLIALIAASSALGTIIFFMICFWIYHKKRLLESDLDSSHSSSNFFLIFRYSSCRNTLLQKCSVLRTIEPYGVKGIALGQVMCKFNSLKSTYSCKKATSVCLMEYKTLESATNNFQESEILGEGGFGCVYKAKLEDNLYVAVKKLEGGTQDTIKEFETEVELLSQIQHPNIISLLGYCIHGDTRLLVYELMQNGSLESQLHGPSRGSALTWHHIMKIALDAAR